MDKIRVLIADDQEIICRGLAMILDHQVDIVTVGQARDGEEAIRLARELKPDIVLMDIKMPRMNGIQATRIITNELPQTQVIILTTYDSDDWVFEGIRAGAQAYLLKDAGTDELANAIRGVHHGESQLDPAIARKVMEEFRRLSAPRASLLPMPPPTTDAPSSQELVIEDLTERETEVLTLIAQGKSNKDIAAQLFLSEGTVKNYVSAIMAKLHANDRTQVVIKAVQQGIVKL
ncbi:MAG: response regulator transcription factor [Chloroflexi bacterium]|nr:response regulator transcription factor [Chloroflexota bacterium]